MFFIKKIHAAAFVIIILILFVYLQITSTKESQNKIPDNYNLKYHTIPRSIFEIPYELKSSPCKISHKILMVVTSYIGHVELRSAHRRALTPDVLEELGVKRVFLLAKTSKLDRFIISQESVNDESARFGDLVQGDFVEAYRNLTLKHVMGLKWASDNCPLTDFVIKFDDDIVFNLENILKHVYKYHNRDKENFLMGYVIKGMKPIHNQANKWYVTKTEFQKSYYPPFLSGWMYVTSPQTARKLFLQALQTQYFWIDDVFVTGILATKVGIKLIDIRSENLYLEYFELLDCCLNDMLKKNILCEFSVGPNGGNNNLFVKFAEAIKNCALKQCIQRPSDKPLKDTCVSLKNSLPLDRGSPVINILKL